MKYTACFLVGVLLSGFSVWFLAKNVYSSPEPRINMVVLEEAAHEVLKLCCAEKTFRADYNRYIDDGYWGSFWDTNVEVAIIGNAAYGYTLDSVDLVIDSLGKTMRITFPEASLLYFETDVLIKSATHGWFTYLDQNDYNPALYDAKESLKQRAYRSTEAFQLVAIQRQKVMRILEAMKPLGWKLDIIEKA